MQTHFAPDNNRRVIDVEKAKKNWVRTARPIAVLGTALLAGACGTQTVVTSGSTTTSAGTSTTAAPAAPATIGTALQLKAETGSEATVTLTGVVDPATGSDEFNQPNTGNKLVAIEFTITNDGKSNLQPDPQVETTIFDNVNATFNADFDTVSDCQTLNSVVLTPGSTENGCVVFQVPSANTVSKVQYTPLSGFSSVTGQWVIPASKG